jgi:putative membrane protein
LKGFILRILITALGLWVAAEIVPGIYFADVPALFLAAVLLGIINAAVRPVIIVLTFPITLLTLGLFLLVINALMLGLVAMLMPRFELDGLVAALLGSIVISLTSWFASLFVGPKGRVEMLGMKRRERREYRS